MIYDFSIARRALIAVFVVSSFFTFFTAEIVGIEIDYTQTLSFSGYFAAIIFAANVYCRRRKIPDLGAAADALGCGLLLTVPILLSSYLAIQLNLPLVDDTLSSWDVAIGVDWSKFIALVDEVAILAIALEFAYGTFPYQLLLVPVLLVATRQILRTYQMMIAYAFICFTASFISIWFPALGTYSVYEMDPGDLQNINAYYGYFFLEQFHAVRNDPNFVFKLRESAGILTFPSVHAGVALLCAWAAWSISIIRYPFMLLNVLMAVSAVSHANHYVVDVLAGLMLAAVCVFLTCRLTGKRQGVDLAGQPIAIPA